MNKKDLIISVANASAISKDQAKKAVDTVFESIESALKEEGKAAFVGFGTFSTKHRPASTRPNPLQKGKNMTIMAKNLIKFKPGKALEESINA